MCNKIHNLKYFIYFVTENDMEVNRETYILPLGDMTATSGDKLSDKLGSQVPGEENLHIIC